MRVVTINAYWHYPEVAYAFHVPLTKVGHNVSAVLYDKEKKGLTIRRITNGFTVYEVPGIDILRLVNSKEKYPIFFNTSRTIKKLNPDLIDCQSHLFYTSFQACRYAKKHHVPLVLTVHGVFAKKSAMVSFAEQVHIRTLANYMFKNATLVRCLTESDKKEIMRFGCSEKKIRIIPNAVDTDRFKPNSNSDRSKIVWVGRFVADKDLFSLVKAIQIVSQTVPDVQVQLIGDGPLKPQILKLVNELGLKNNIAFTGALGLNEVSKIIGAAGIFFLPSLKEGMPNSVLEAMSSGLAVVGSDIPGIRSLVTNNETGLIVPTNNPQAMAKAILSLLTDVNFSNRLGKNARQYITQYYSWSTAVKRIDKLYSEALDLRSHP